MRKARYAWDYDPEIGDIICERISSGKSLRTICKDEKLPGLSTVFKWIAKSPAFAEQYARARNVQADVIFDEILDIADTPRMGVRTKNNAMGVETTEADMIEHRRLQIDARRWMLGKLAPKKYGDKTSIEHMGPNGGPIEYRDLSGLSDSELDAIERIGAKIADPRRDQSGED